MCYLEKVIELLSLEILQDDIDWVLGLVDSLKFHHIHVVEPPHDFDLVF